MIGTTTAPTALAPREIVGARAGGRRRRLGELLLVGGLTPLLFPLSWWLRAKIGLDASDYAFGFTTFYLAYVINDPHFAVTYLLFYRDARARMLGPALGLRQRVRYVVAGAVVPAVLAVWAITALATRSAPLLGLLIQLMFLLVGWHYVKQGFGVMMALSARRGVRFGRVERAVVLAHCLAGWAYAWASPYDPGRELQEKGVIYWSLAHPRWLEGATFAVCLASGVAFAVMLALKRAREGGLPIATPVLALLCSIWPWSIYSAIDPLVRYVVPALHSVQYLYFVWLLRAPEAREREGPPWFESSARTRLGLLAAGALGLGWLLFHGAPEVLDGALVPRRERLTALGPTPYFAAIYAFVNIHHYAMDAVLWRRDNPETRYLLQ